MSAPLFTVATFGRVFDVHPAVDALTLPELALALSRFQLKTDLARREQRELARARQVHQAFLAGTRPDGPLVPRFERLVAKHLTRPDAPTPPTSSSSSAGAPANAALDTGSTRDPGTLDLALADLEREIRREAKQDLRLWAPLLFAPGGKRDDVNVVHISAMVFDFDRGMTPERLATTFAHLAHLAHTTWSHTPSSPKLRLVLPLSAPIAPADFDRVWHALDEVTGHLADPTGRALARAWALPAVPARDTPRLAWAHTGPLFDPFQAGLASAPSPAPVPAPTGRSFMRPDPDETFLDAPTLTVPKASVTPDAPTPPSPTFDPWDGGAALPRPLAPRPGPSAQSVTSPPTPPAAGPEDPVQARIAALEARVAALERLLADYV
jgi:hypothetical protein